MNNKIVAIHGFTADKNIFIGLKYNLEKVGLELIPLDLPGHGENLPNPQQKLPSTTFSIDYYADKIIEELTTRGYSKYNKITLLGHSFGGAVAILISCKVPELIKDLCLIAPGGIYTKDTEKAYQLLGGVGANLQNKEIKGLFHIYNRADLYNMFSLIYYKKIRLSSSEEERIINHYTTNSKWYTKLIKDTPWYNWQNLTPDECSKSSLNCHLKQIKAKTMIIWGANDALLKVSAAYFIHQEIKNSNLNIIENVGHSPLQESPKETAKIIINFLSNK